MKPFARIAKARIYRRRIVNASHMRYLNLAALKKARRAEIELGSVTVGALTAVIVAEIKQGLITRLRPAHCQKCGRRRSIRARAQRDRTKLLRNIFSKRAPGTAPTALPIPVERLAGSRSNLTITIVITPDGILCLLIEIGGYGCLICTDGTTCFRPSVPPVD